MDSIVNFFTSNWGTIAAILFLISELLGSSEKFKSNSIFQFIQNLLKKDAKVPQ